MEDMKREDDKEQKRTPTRTSADDLKKVAENL